MRPTSTTQRDRLPIVARASGPFAAMFTVVDASRPSPLS